MEEIIKLNSMESSSTLFEKAIPVRVSRLPGVEDRLMEFTIRIIMGISKHHRSTKVLRMQLTEEADPFFLYFLEVTEDDFQNLKVEQCILVDFAAFPHKFIELLEHCIDAGNNDSPRFQAILNVRTGDSTFSVVEANQFKHLSHLSLCFRQGNDSTIKTYLAGRLAEFKAANGDLHEKLRRTLMSLEMALRENGNMTSELAELRENNSCSMSQLKAEYTIEIAHEKQKAIQEVAQAKEKFEKDRLDLEKRLRQQTEEQQGHLMELEKQVQELMDFKHTSEVRIAEAQAQHVELEKELDKKKKECERLQTENQNLDSAKQEASMLLSQHLVRLGKLDQEVQDKSELVSSLQKQLEVQTFQRASIELSFKDAQVAADRAEERYKSREDELKKCHQAVEKLQAELRACKEKVRLRGQIASQQDNLLLERQTAIERTMQENSALKQEISTVKEEKNTLSKKVDELKAKIEEAQELQQSNQRMIQWLNQQLTDAQLGKLGSTSRFIIKPNLSILQNLDTVGRGTTNLVAPSFSASASMNGALLCNTYKSMRRASSPFGQATVPKTAGAVIDNGIPSLTFKPSKLALASNPTLKHCVTSNGFSPTCLYSSCGELTTYEKPTCQLMPKLDLSESAATLSSTALAVSSGLDEGPLTHKDRESTWKLLPRPPPLSFVDAKCELLCLTSTKSSSNGRDTSALPRSKAHQHSPRERAATPTPAQKQSADVS